MHFLWDLGPADRPAQMLIKLAARLERLPADEAWEAAVAGIAAVIGALNSRGHHLAWEKETDGNVRVRILG